MKYLLFLMEPLYLYRDFAKSGQLEYLDNSLLIITLRSASAWIDNSLISIANLGASVHI